MLQKGTGYLLDQALSSGGNFAVSLLVARVMGVESFGYFALTMSIWVFLLSMLRAGIIQPLIVAIGAKTCTTPVARGRVTILATGLGALTAIGALLGALVAEGELSNALAGMALAIVPVLVHEGMRSLSLAAGEPWRAVSADALWVVGTLAALTVLALSGTLTPGTAVMAWGGGALLGLLPFARRQLVHFAGINSIVWFRSTAKTSAAFTAAAVSASAGAQAVVWLVAIALTPAAVGGLKAAQNLMVPGRMAANSVETFFLRRLAASSDDRLMAESRSFIMIGVASVALWLLAVLTMAGLGFPPMQTIFGTSFAPFENLLVPLGWGSLLATFTAAELLIIRSRLDGRSAVQLAAISTVAKVVLATAGAVLANALGVAIGLLAAEVVLFVSARQLRARHTLEASSNSRAGGAHG
jgi:O-antigen/teichoic acid export membrane protein